MSDPSLVEVLAGLRAVSDGHRQGWQGPAHYSGGDGAPVAVRLSASAVRSAGAELVAVVLHLEGEGPSGEPHPVTLPGVPTS